MSLFGNKLYELYQVVLYTKIGIKLKIFPQIYLNVFSLHLICQCFFRNALSEFHQ